MTATDWFVGWNGAPRLGLEPKAEKTKYGEEEYQYPPRFQGVAKWQHKLNEDYVFILQVRLALEYLQHFRQIPEWEEAVSISMGHGCYRKRPSNAVFGG